MKLRRFGGLQASRAWTWLKVLKGSSLISGTTRCHFGCLPSSDPGKVRVNSHNVTLTSTRSLLLVLQNRVDSLWRPIVQRILSIADIFRRIFDDPNNSRKNPHGHSTNGAVKSGKTCLENLDSSGFGRRRLLPHFLTKIWTTSESRGVASLWRHWQQAPPPCAQKNVNE